MQGHSVPKRTEKKKWANQDEEQKHVTVAKCWKTSASHVKTDYDWTTKTKRLMIG